MPERERVESFVACVVSGKHVEAIEEYYHVDASMQENLTSPRRGRDALLQHEKSALAKVSEVRTHSPEAVLIDGDHVAVRWVFDVIGKDGLTRRLEEVALQRWRGDRIEAEQFFYDTATAWQIVPASDTKPV